MPNGPTRGHIIRSSGWFTSSVSHSGDCPSRFRRGTGPQTYRNRLSMRRRYTYSDLLLRSMRCAGDSRNRRSEAWRSPCCPFDQPCCRGGRQVGVPVLEAWAGQPDSRPVAEKEVGQAGLVGHDCYPPTFGRSVAEGGGSVGAAETAGGEHGGAVGVVGDLGGLVAVDEARRMHSQQGEGVGGLDCGGASGDLFVQHTEQAVALDD